MASLIVKLGRPNVSKLLEQNNFDNLMKYFVRGATKKTGGSTKNHGNARPKKRGIYVNDGRFVQTGTLLVVQNYLRFHPGLNVGFGRNGTLYAMVPGVVRVTCEKPNLNMDHAWVKMFYGGRSIENMYKKYFNVIPEEQHNRFKLIDQI